MNKIPKVVVVGRTNVGKSSFFNRIAPIVKSLVLDQEGVTRDFISDVATWNGISFELIDTGGIALYEKVDDISDQVTERVEKLLKDDAAIVLFMVDLQTGISDQDQRIAKLLHTLDKPVYVLVNKVDTEEHEMQMFGFQRLGFKNLHAISASHGRGIADILDIVVDQLKSMPVVSKKEVENGSDFRVSFLGRPNAGKSSLMNKLTGQELSIVSPEAGTTRESLRRKIGFNKKVVELIDTAGVRKKAGVSTKLESMMVTNALQMAKRSHIVLMLIDVEEPELTSQELKLASYAFDNGSAVIILFNKIDLLDELKKADLDHSMLEYKYFLKKLETLSISCKTDKNVGKVLPLVQKVWDRFNIRLSDEYLTKIFLDALIETPLYKNGKRITFFNARQVSVAPMRIELIIANKELFEESHVSFFENILRKNVDLKSMPTLFYVKQRSDLAKAKKKKK